MVWRRGAWFPTKDRGWVDADGYFYHAGRADDVIISAGWTMSAVEIEDVLLKHPDVREAAVIGVADALRGQVVKAFIVSPRAGRRRVRARAAGLRADAPEPARVSAPRGLRPRASQDAGGQDQPQGAARFRDSGAGGAHACPLTGRRTHDSHDLDVPEDHRRGPRRPPAPHRRRDHRHARALVPRGHARRHPPLRARHRRRQSALVRSGVRERHALGRRRRAAQLSLRDEPHHLRLCRRAARRPRHVGRRRLDLASARAAQRRDHDRGVAQGPGRAPDGVRRPRDPADLSRRLLQPARRARSRPPTAGASAPTATSRASTAPSTPR